MLNAGDILEFIVLDEREALIRPVSKKVDETFGMLHRPGRKAVSVDEINEKIKQKMKDRF
jgi:hypothetical protein